LASLTHILWVCINKIQTMQQEVRGSSNGTHAHWTVSLKKYLFWLHLHIYFGCINKIQTMQQEVGGSSRIFPSSLSISQLFRKVLLISIAIQILTQGLLLAFVSNDSQIRTHYAVLTFTRVVQVPQVVAIVYGTWILVTHISVASLVDAWIMYLSTILCFSGIYHVLHSGATATAFESDDPRTIQGDPSHVYASMLYLSVSTQTLTGYGDITASGTAGRVFCSLQMLAGMLYSVFIISHTQEIFFDRVRFIDVKRHDDDNSRRGICGRCWDFFTKNNYVRKMRQFVREYLVLISTLIYVTNFLTLQYLEPDVFGNWEYRIGVLVMEILFQIMQIGSVVMTSWKFVKHMDEITVSFLSQAFVAICLTFSGLYNLIFAFSAVNNKCFSLPEFEIGKTSSLTVVLQLLYFSISTMTSAGQGDVYPRRWYNFFFLRHSLSYSTIFNNNNNTHTHTHTHPKCRYAQWLVCTQMLISVLFTVVFLGRGVTK